MLTLDKYGDKKHRIPFVIYQYLGEDAIRKEINHYKRIQRNTLNRHQRRVLWQVQGGRSIVNRDPLNFREDPDQMKGWKRHEGRFLRGHAHASRMIDILDKALTDINGWGLKDELKGHTEMREEELKNA